MKANITLFAVAVAAIFSSCSKEANFSNSGQSYGGYHKTEQAPVAQANSQAAEEPVLTASTEIQPEIASKTISFAKAAKTVQAQTSNEAASEVAVATAAKSHKEVKAIAKQLKKEIKNTKEAKSEGKSQVIALILAILVGVVGIHRFYLGYTGIGIAQIFTLGGCGIWTLIDIIRIITGDLQPKNGSYSKTL